MGKKGELDEVCVLGGQFRLKVRVRVTLMVRLRPITKVGNTKRKRECGSEQEAKRERGKELFEVFHVARKGMEHFSHHPFPCADPWEEHEE